jgi:hypothetical protein
VNAACLFCHARLGTNEAIEHFPVGRRLAFDASKGRLWVVCGRCRRWNLTPIEERWEAIEECERAFRATRLRSSTPNIGLARLPSDLTLIRVGTPLRPELAAWRYVDVIRRRRVVALATSGVALAACAGVGLGAFALTGMGAVGSVLYSARNAWITHRAIHRVRLPSNRWLTVRQKHLALATWTPPNADGHMRLAITTRRGHEPVHIAGPAAQRALRPILAHLNRRAGSRGVVTSALQILDDVGGSPFHERNAARVLWVRRANGMPPSLRAEAIDAFDAGQEWPMSLAGMRSDERLALEIELAEDDERQLIAGELAELESAWREAEEIAAIADDLLLPAHISQWLEHTKRGGSR